MLKIKNYAVGMLVGVSIASTLSATNQYNNQRQQQYGQGYQQNQQNSQTPSTSPRQTGKNVVPQGPGGLQPSQTGKRFSYEMHNPQNQGQAPRTQCPTLTRPEFTSLLTKGSVVAANGMTLKKASSGSKGALGKKFQALFKQKQENTYEGVYIAPTQLDNVAEQRGIKIDQMAMSSGGLDSQNRGFCIYTHKPGGKPEDLLAAIFSKESLEEPRQRQEQNRRVSQEYLKKPGQNQDFKTPSEDPSSRQISRNPIPKNPMTGQPTGQQRPSSNQMVPSQMDSDDQVSRNPVPKNPMTGQRRPSSNQMVPSQMDSDDQVSRNPIPKNPMTGQRRPSSNQMDSDDQGEMDDRQVIRNLAGKVVGYTQKRGVKPPFWKSLTNDEKSFVNDLKAKSESGTPLKQEEQGIYDKVENIMENESGKHDDNNHQEDRERPVPSWVKDPSRQAPGHFRTNTKQK